MLPNNCVLSLTGDLLAFHAFSHLRDDEVSALHHIILKHSGPISTVQQNLLLSCWNHAVTANIPPALLHRCNTVLLQLGRNPMEENIFETGYPN